MVWENDLIVYEDLRVFNVVKFNLVCFIFDVGWSVFFDILCGKVESVGCVVVWVFF